MFQRPSRERKPENEDRISDDPIRLMREPLGALGDIVRRMKRHAALQRSIGITREIGRDAA